MYSYMFSIFGVAAMSGTFFVSVLQPKIGYSGMLYLCMGTSGTAMLLAILYKFEKLNYWGLFGF